MKIKTVISQHRRDGQAIFECETCGHCHEGSFYDDAHFHNNVIPTLICPECGEVSPEGYRPLATKYREGEQI